MFSDFKTILFLVVVGLALLCWMQAGCRSRIEHWQEMRQQRWEQIHEDRKERREQWQERWEDREHREWRFFHRRKPQWLKEEYE